jgi:hypothetical protein
MLIRALLIFVAWCALVGCGAPREAAEPRDSKAGAGSATGSYRAPGSRVRLRLTDGFVRPNRFLTFVHDKPLVIVTVLDVTASPEFMQGVLRGMRRALEDELGAKLSSADTARGGARGFVLDGKSSQHHVKFVALATQTAACAVTVFHEEAGEKLAAEIAASVELDESAAMDPLAAHGLGAKTAPGLELWPVMNHPVMFKEPGVTPPMAPDKAVFAILIAPYGDTQPSDRELGSMLGAILRELEPNMQGARMQEAEVGGGRLFEVVTRGKKDGIDIGIYASLLKDTGAAIVSYGHVGADREASFVESFRSIARSVERRPGTIGPVAINAERR